MRRPFRLIAVAASLGAVSLAAQSSSELDLVLRGVADRISDYYKRAQNVMCIEKIVMQPIGVSFGPEGLSRTTESELRVETVADDGDGDGAGEAKVVRVIRKINGRPPKVSEKAKKDPSGCTDPNPLSPEPLTFLLPAHREEYAFALAGRGKGKDAGTLIIEFKTIPRGPKPEIFEAENGLEGCYESRGIIPTTGRVWVDAATFDVQRIEERLTGPVDLRVSDRLRRKRNLNDLMVMDRMDVTIRYKKVVFHDPDEVMLLPETIDDLRMWRGGLQSARRRQVYTEYRRFVTDARLVK